MVGSCGDRGRARGVRLMGTHHHRVWVEGRGSGNRRRSGGGGIIMGWRVECGEVSVSAMFRRWSSGCSNWRKGDWSCRKVG